MSRSSARDEIRRVVVGILDELGLDDPLTITSRTKLLPTPNAARLTVRSPRQDALDNPVLPGATLARGVCQTLPAPRRAGPDLEAWPAKIEPAGEVKYQSED